MIFNFLKKKSKIVSIIPTQAASKMKEFSNAVLIDVREAEEVARGAAQGSVNIPLSLLMQDNKMLPSDQTTPLFFICQSGGRSAKAAEIAEHMGYQKVYNISGGTSAWQSMGLPMN